MMLILEPGNYFTLKNMRSMIYQFPEYGILSLGMMACMIAGGIDLTVVAVADLALTYVFKEQLTLKGT